MVGDGHSITISIGTTDDYNLGGPKAIRSCWTSLESVHSGESKLLESGSAFWHLTENT